MLGGLMRFACSGKQVVGGLATSPGLRPAVTNSCFRTCRRAQSQAPVAPWTHSESSGALMCRSAAVDADEAPVEIEPLPVHAMDIRVGKIIEIEQHPDADSLYVEKVDVGEEEPRTIISGLVEFVPLEEMKDREVIVLCNLKPRNMRGIKSFGMLMCASDTSHERVEPLAPTPGTPVGERVFFGDGGQAQAEPETPNRVQKKKMWEGVQPDLKTDDNCAAFYMDVPMLTSAGPVTCASLTGASIS